MRILGKYHSKFVLLMLSSLLGLWKEVWSQPNVLRDEFSPLKFIWVVKQGVTIIDPATESTNPTTLASPIQYTMPLDFAHIPPAVLKSNFPATVSSMTFVLRFQFSSTQLELLDLAKIKVEVTLKNPTSAATGTFTLSLAALCVKLNTDNSLLYTSPTSCIIPNDAATQSKLQVNIYTSVVMDPGSCFFKHHTHYYAQYLLGTSMRKVYHPAATGTSCIESILSNISGGNCGGRFDLSAVKFTLSYSHTFFPSTLVTVPGFFSKAPTPIVSLKVYPEIDLSTSTSTGVDLCKSLIQDQFEGAPMELKYDFPLIDFDQASIFDIASNISSRLDPDGSANLDISNAKRQTSSFDFVDKSLNLYSLSTPGLNNLLEGSSVLTMWFMIRKVGPYSTPPDITDLTQIRLRYRFPRSSAYPNHAIYINFREESVMVIPNPDPSRDPDRRYYGAFVSVESTSLTHIECNFMMGRNNFATTPLYARATPFVLMTKQWYQLKVHAMYKYQGQYVTFEITISSASNPQQVLLFADKNSARGIANSSLCTFKDFQMTGNSDTNKFWYSIDEIGVNYFNGRVGEIKYYIGNVGYFRDNTQLNDFLTWFSLPVMSPFNNNFLPYCLEGINYHYLLILGTGTVTAGAYKYTEYSFRDCFMCASQNQMIPASLINYPLGSKWATSYPSYAGRYDPKWKFSQMLWNEGHCSLRCNKWMKEDFKTGTCKNYQTILSQYDFSINTPDTGVCGDTYFQDSPGWEACELYNINSDTPPNPALCTKDCQLNPSFPNSQQHICRRDPYGKTNCEMCSLQLCNLKRTEEFYFKKCISVCQFVFEKGLFNVKALDSQKNSKGGAITQGDQAYYFDEKTLQQTLCETSEINIQDKMYDPVKAMRNCDFCTLSSFFYKNNNLNFCFEVDRNPLQTYPFKDELITDSGIDIMGYVISAIAILMALIGVLFLFPIGCISLFFRFWELMQFFYMMSYYIDRSFQTHQFFRKFTFVTFEIFDFKGWIMPNLLGLLLPTQGLILVDEPFRNLLSQLEFTKYKNKMKVYMQMGKVGLLMFDAGAILDITLITIALVILIGVVMSIIAKNSTRESTIAFVRKYRKAASTAYPTFFTWFIMENLPVFLFYTLAQLYMIPSRVGDIYNRIFAINKTFLFFFMAVALFGMPIYTMGVAVKAFKDDVMLDRIKSIGFKGTGIGMKTLYPISIIRRLLFTLFFSPGVNFSGNTFYLFLVVVIEIIELNILFFAESWEYKVVTFLQIFGAALLLFLSFLLMADRLMNSVFQLAKVGSSNYNLLSYYYQWRERALVVGVLTIVSIYVLGVIYALITLRKTISTTKSGSKTRNDEEYEDDTGKPSEELEKKEQFELGAL